MGTCSRNLKRSYFRGGLQTGSTQFPPPRKRASKHCSLRAWGNNGGCAELCRNSMAQPLLGGGHDQSRLLWGCHHPDDDYSIFSDLELLSLPEWLPGIFSKWEEAVVPWAPRREEEECLLRCTYCVPHTRCPRCPVLSEYAWFDLSIKSPAFPITKGFGS